MIKYTILYRNRKTWNGKALFASDIHMDDDVLAVVYRVNGCIIASAERNYLGNLDRPTVIGEYQLKPKRTPNPKSKTKKQKAFDEAYVDWATRVVLSGQCTNKQEWSIKAYKKWLYEQRKTNSIKCFPSFSVGNRIGYYPQGSNELVWCTITESGYTPPNNIKITAMMPSEIDKVITQIRLSYEEVSPDEQQKITFPSGATISWDGVYKPWKESAIERFHKQVEEHRKFMDEAEGIPVDKLTVICTDNTWKELGWGNRTKPIKTTYTFWLGAFGEIND